MTEICTEIIQSETPKKKTYTEGDMLRDLNDCKGEKEGVSREIGSFKFSDHNYGENITADSPTGGIIEIAVSCFSAKKDEITDFSYGNFKIAGENALKTLYEKSGFGDASYITFMHDGLQYKINEYVHVSFADKKREQKIRKDYGETFNKIISSLKF